MNKQGLRINSKREKKITKRKRALSGSLSSMTCWLISKGKLKIGKMTNTLSKMNHHLVLASLSKLKYMTILSSLPVKPNLTLKSMDSIKMKIKIRVSKSWLSVMNQHRMAR